MESVKSFKKCTCVNTCHCISGQSNTTDVCEGFKNYLKAKFVDSWSENTFSDQFKKVEHCFLSTYEM